MRTHVDTLWTLWESDPAFAQQSIHQHRVPRTERAMAAYAQGWAETQATSYTTTKLSATLYTGSSCQLAQQTVMDDPRVTVALVAEVGPTPVRRSYDNISAQVQPRGSVPTPLAQSQALTVTLLQTHLCKLLTAACLYHETTTLGDILDNAIGPRPV